MRFAGLLSSLSSGRRPGLEKDAVALMFMLAAVAVEVCVLGVLRCWFWCNDWKAGDAGVLGEGGGDVAME